MTRLRCYVGFLDLYQTDPDKFIDEIRLEQAEAKKAGATECQLDFEGWGDNTLKLEGYREQTAEDIAAANAKEAEWLREEQARLQRQLAAVENKMEGRMKRNVEGQN